MGPGAGVAVLLAAEGELLPCTHAGTNYSGSSTFGTLSVHMYSHVPIEVI